MRRIRDGNDIKPPRNLIDLISMAKQAQLRREDRESRDYSEGTPLIEGDSLRRALTQLSTQRVQDTLLAEAAAYAKLISRFRDGKAEHNAESLSKLLEVDVAAVRSTIEPLLEIGFVETIKGAVGETFKIPSLYRDGLNITQGKAFDAAGPDADEDEEE
jgi:Fic family protein